MDQERASTADSPKDNHSNEANIVGQFTVCDPCQFKGLKVVASMFCLDCHESLCESCSETHSAFKLFRSHRLVNRDCMNDKTEQHITQLSEYMQCGCCGNRQVEFFCVEENTMCCPICVAYKHRACSQIRKISLCTRLNDIRIGKVTYDLDNMKKYWQNLARMKQDSITDVEVKVKEIPKKIEEVRKQLNDLCDILDTYARKEANEYSKRLSMLATEDIDTYTSNIGTIETTMELVKTAQRHGSDVNVAVLCHKLENTVHIYNCRIEDEFSKFNISSVEFAFRNALLKLLKAANDSDLQKLVHIDEIKSQDNAPAYKENKLKRNELQGSFQEIELKPLNSTLVVTTDICNHINVCDFQNLTDHTINTREHDIDGATYTGVSFFPDGKMVVIGTVAAKHSKATRGCCSLLDTKTLSVISVRFDYLPQSVTVLGNKIMISCPSEKRVILISTCDGLEYSNSIDFQRKPMSLTNLSDGRLAVSWYDPAAFGIVQMQGTRIKEYVYFVRDSTGRVIETFDHIAVDVKRKHVVQPCSKTQSVHVFTFDGIPVFKYSHKDLDLPRGVAVDMDGNIYVCNCGFEAKGIHRISTAGQLLGVISADESFKLCPLGISFDKRAAKFAITQAGNINQVVLFKK